MIWKNVTTISQDAKHGPSVYETQLGRFRLVVHRHIHYPANVWLASCESVLNKRELASRDIEDAKSEAVEMLRVILTNALKAMGKE